MKKGFIGIWASVVHDAVGAGIDRMLQVSEVQKSATAYIGAKYGYDTFDCLDCIIVYIYCELKTSTGLSVYSASCTRCYWPLFSTKG